METLVAPLDRAHRFVLGTGIGTLETGL